MSGKGHEAAFPAGWVGDAHTVFHLTDPMEGIKHIAALAREHRAPTGSRQVASVGLPSLAWPQELVPRPGHAPAGEAPAGRQAPKATSLHPRNPRPQGTGGEARGLSILKTLRKQVPCVSFLAHPNGLRGLKMGQSSHTCSAQTLSRKVFLGPTRELLEAPPKLHLSRPLPPFSSYSGPQLQGTLP